MLPHRTAEQFAYSKASWLFSWRRLWRFGVLVNRIPPIRSSEASGRHGSRPALATTQAFRRHAMRKHSSWCVS